MVSKAGKIYPPAVQRSASLHDEKSLNTALVEKRIAPEKIISMMFQPGRAMAIGNYEAKYRIIYRT